VSARGDAGGAVVTATSLGYVDPTLGHIPCHVCKQYIECPVTTTFLPGEPGQVRSVTSVDQGPLWDHAMFEHGVDSVFGGAL
jgi:hypothetical protein